MGARLSDTEMMLGRAADELEQHWQNTAGSWRDKARDDFEHDHLEDLGIAVKRAQQAMKNINQLLREVIRECS